jgi:succinate-semialdehyde dehydrogenase/glutarate-semialdehyde dehydrogenase
VIVVENLRYDRILRDLQPDPAAPFGEMRQSGIGREGAHEGIKEYLEPHYVSVSW